MDKYGKKFIKASLIYLGFGLIMGIHLAVSDHAFGEVRFVHVHVMLLGFMMMMICGVAYHILPRFNAKALKYPSWVGYHFWLANTGLIGMVFTYFAGAYFHSLPFHPLFALFGIMEAVALFMFIINLYGVLQDEVEEPPAAEPQPEPESEPLPDVKLAPSMKMAEIIEKYPHLRKHLTDEGFGDLVNPAAMNSIAKMVTLEMAAKKAGVELFPLLAKLEGKDLIKVGDEPAEEPSGELPPGAKPEQIIARGDKATTTTLIGPLLEVYPETKPVFEANYGAACFTCPGQKTETIEQTAQMHGMPAKKILDEVNSIIETALK